MFNWFGRKGTNAGHDNVYNLSTPKSYPEMPEVKEPKEEPGKIYYRLGLTDNNRVAFSMGYSEVTMNRRGCQDLIDQIKFFQSKLEDDDNGGGGPDGGEPVPVPESESEETGLKLVKAA